MRGVFWTLQEHPVVLITVIAVAGLPVGYYATRYANREAQKRAIWSGLRDQVQKGSFSIPEPDLKDRILGAAIIDNVFFRAVSIEVTDEGIRLDRPFVDTRPISIPWREIQRVDRLTQRIKKELMSAAAIRAKHSNSELIVSPWDSDQQERVPESVGVCELRPPT